MGLPTVVEISDWDPFSCGSAERVLCQGTLSQAFFDTLQVGFWKHSPKILDFTGYSVSLLFADGLFSSFICHAFETNTSQVFKILTHLRQDTPLFFLPHIGFIGLY